MSAYNRHDRVGCRRVHAGFWRATRNILNPPPPRKSSNPEIHAVRFTPKGVSPCKKLRLR
ncbi:hypothetical protein FM102_08505 [Corynebacterium glutamicum]|nr:hypothetical protein FM102_08505 [Corynebacterium glutamicum]